MMFKIRLKFKLKLKVVVVVAVVVIDKAGGLIDNVYIHTFD